MTNETKKKIKKIAGEVLSVVGPIILASAIIVVGDAIGKKIEESKPKKNPVRLIINDKIM